jgi:hypothetical protein
MCYSKFLQMYLLKGILYSIVLYFNEFLTNKNLLNNNYISNLIHMYRLLTPRKFNLFLIYNLPSAFLCGVRVRHIDNDQCHVGVRHKWINKNPFKSMFWAVQGMAAELATGALIIMKIKKLDKRISMLVVKNEAQFTKKAKGHITFRCLQGKEIDAILKKAIETGDGHTFALTAEGYDESGDLVSTFNFIWSVKQKP